MKIIWSQFAEQQLDDIFDFYGNNVNIEFAAKTIKSIINQTNILLKTPFIGQKEILLENRIIEYRYLVYKHYKLIYSVDLEKEYIKIADVFDTRQNPEKLYREK